MRTLQTTTNRNRPALVLSMLVSLAIATDASAGRVVRVDVGNNLEATGQSWNTIEAVDVSDNLNSGAVLLGFSIDFGTGTIYDSLFINENGFVSFGTAPVEWTDTTELTTLDGNIIAPYYANLTSGNSSGPQPGFSAGTVSSSTGQIDLAEDNDSDTPAGPTVPAFRVTWFDVGIPGYTNGFSAPGLGTIQLVLFDTDGAAGNNFDFEFNYDLTNPPAPRAAGFVLGTNVVDYVGPFTGDVETGPEFHFCGGAFSATRCTVTPPPTTVPEPNAFTLLCTGLALMASVAALRRRSTPQLAR